MKHRTPSPYSRYKLGARIGGRVEQCFFIVYCSALSNYFLLCSPPVIQALFGVEKCPQDPYAQNPESGTALVPSHLVQRVGQEKSGHWGGWRSLLPLAPTPLASVWHLGSPSGGPFPTCPQTAPELWRGSGGQESCLLWAPYPRPTPGTQGQVFRGPLPGAESAMARQAQVRPRCGRLVAFSSGVENPHGVWAVTQGRRCSLALWHTWAPEHGEQVRSERE